MRVYQVSMKSVADIYMLIIYMYIQILYTCIFNIYIYIYSFEICTCSFLKSSFDVCVCADVKKKSAGGGIWWGKRERKMDDGYSPCIRRTTVVWFLHALESRKLVNSSCCVHADKFFRRSVWKMKKINHRTQFRKREKSEKKDEKALQGLFTCTVFQS